MKVRRRRRRKLLTELKINGPCFAVYTCHGSWTHNGTVFIVARHVGSQHGVCMSYRPIEAGSAQLIIGDVCLRSQQSPMEHHLVANLTVHGKRGERILIRI